MALKPEDLMATRSKYSSMMLPVKQQNHMEDRPAATNIMDRAHAGPTISRRTRPGSNTVRCPGCGAMTMVSDPAKRTITGLYGKNITMPAYCSNCGGAINTPAPSGPHPNDSSMKGYARG